MDYKKMFRTLSHSVLILAVWATVILIPICVIDRYSMARIIAVITSVTVQLALCLLTIYLDMKSDRSPGRLNKLDKLVFKFVLWAGWCNSFSDKELEVTKTILTS
jgi:predicted membrane channel-forming protein YqfA (hemolysin III family)